MRTAIIVFCIVAALIAAGCSSGKLPSGFLDSRNPWTVVSSVAEERDLKEIENPSVEMVRKLETMLKGGDVEGTNSLLAPEIVAFDKDARQKILEALVGGGNVKVQLLTMSKEPAGMSPVKYSIAETKDKKKRFNVAAYWLNISSSTHHSTAIFALVETKEKNWIGYALLTEYAIPTELGNFKEASLGELGNKKVLLSFLTEAENLKAKKFKAGEVKKDGIVLCQSEEITIETSKYNPENAHLSFYCNANLENEQAYQVVLKTDKKDYVLTLKV